MSPSFLSTFLLALGLSSLSTVAGQQCQLQFDGRVPPNFVPASFDTANNVFNPSNVIGKGLSFSKVVLLPKVTPSLFDVASTQAVELTISDLSIFAPSADNVQNGFRRAELLIASNDGTDASTLGVKTLHFSVMKDAQRPLNLSHEYQLVFLEDNKFSTNQIVLKTGTVLGQKNNAPANPDTLQLFGNVAKNPPDVLFSVPFANNAFHNFAVTMDFDKNTTQVFFSAGNAPLKAVTQPMLNDLGGQGQFHFGVLKKGIGGGDNIVKNGVQPAGINEGVIYGGIFEEDSTGGCVSLSPTTKATVKLE